MFEEAGMDFLKDNQKLRIVPDEIKEISEGIIREIHPEYFVVQLESTKGEPLKLEGIIEIIIPTEKCLIRFETKVIELSNNIVRFSTPDKVRHVQRREYSRVNIKLPVELRRLDDSYDIIYSVSQNLGAGGMHILTDETFDFGTLLQAKFTIFSKKEISAIFEVLRTSEDKQESFYHIAGQFKKISNSDRTAIIHLCFKKQLESNYKESE